MGRNYRRRKVYDVQDLRCHLGFGGTGKGPNSCVPDGPFANITVMIGPGFKSQPRCINRRVSNPMSLYSAQSVVDQALKATTYIAAYTAISAGPHTMGHGAQMMMVRGKRNQKVIQLTDTCRTAIRLPRAGTLCSCFITASSISCGRTGRRRIRSA